MIANIGDIMIYSDKSELIEKQSKLIADKMKLDRFFSMYLDKFGSKMDPDKPNTNIWKLYKTKLQEYDNVNREIKTLQYWIMK